MYQDLSDHYKNTFKACLQFVLILLIGTAGFFVISDYKSSLMDCFYMTTMTITTIGFEEVINLDGKPYGRLFTILIAFLGIGILTYLLSNFTALLIEGKLKNDLIKRKMNKSLNHLKDHYIIVGIGRLGINIARELNDSDIDFVAINTKDVSEISQSVVDPEAIKLYITGDATEDSVLESANIKNAKGLFVATKNDNINLVVTLSAKLLNPNLKIISRASTLNHAGKMKKAGADSVILPTTIGGYRMTQEMIKPHITSFIDYLIMDHEHPTNLNTVKLGEAFDGKSLSDIDLSNYPSTIVLAVKEMGNQPMVINPNRSVALKKGDVLILLTNETEKNLLQKAIDQI